MTRKWQRCVTHEGSEGLNKTPFLVMDSGPVPFERAKKTLDGNHVLGSYLQTAKTDLLQQTCAFTVMKVVIAVLFAAVMLTWTCLTAGMPACNDRESCGVFLLFDTLYRNMNKTPGVPNAEQQLCSFSCRHEARRQQTSAAGAQCFPPQEGRQSLPGKSPPSPSLTHPALKCHLSALSNHSNVISHLL